MGACEDPIMAWVMGMTGRGGAIGALWLCTLLSLCVCEYSIDDAALFKIKFHQRENKEEGASGEQASRRY